MSELPELFDFYEKHYGGLPEHARFMPFDFDVRTNNFTAVDREIAAAEFDPFTFNPYILEIDGKGITTFDELRETPLLITYDGRLIGGPRLYDWTDNHRAEIAKKLPALMRRVYRSVCERPEDVPPLRSVTGHLGFQAGVREDNGGISLQVFGNCACFNPSQSGCLTGLRGVEKGFAEYELHNTDSQAQRVSLYAGLGHIAHLASRE